MRACSVAQLSAKSATSSQPGSPAMKCERSALKSTRNGVCGLKFAFAPVSRLLEG
jgi:hypothetical protein